MSHNKILDKDIKELHEYLIDLIEDTKNQYARTFQVLSTGNIADIDKIVENDKRINQKQNDFATLALWKIVKQKMVASDLRFAVGGIIISREIEKIADVAKNICNYVKTHDLSVKNENNKIYNNYLIKLFESINIILELIAGLIENFQEEQDKKVLELEVKMYSEIKSILSSSTKKLSKTLKEHEISKFVKFVRQLKNIEKVSSSLMEIEEIIKFIKTGSFEDMDRLSLISDK